MKYQNTINQINKAFFNNDATELLCISTKAIVNNKMEDEELEFVLDLCKRRRETLLSK